MPPGQCRPCRHHLPARPRHGGPGAGLLGRHPELHGLGERPRLLPRPALRLLGDADAPVAPVRGARVLVERRVPLRHNGRHLLHRLLHHAAEEEPRLRRAHARQDGPRLRRPGEPAHHHEGHPAGLQQGHAGGQGARLRRGRHRGGRPARVRRHGAHHAGQPRQHARRRPGRLHGRHRPGRLPRGQGHALPRGPLGHRPHGAFLREGRQEAPGPDA